MSLSLPNYSGEFFDLSIPSTNDRFGQLHNTGILKYGINFPLEKFIKELEEIVKGESDDKTNKRELRLAFLQYCDTNPCLQFFFTSLCNYLNGKDGTGQQHLTYFVVTAAGGNIIIVFAQLIMNIIDSYSSAASLDTFNSDLFESLLTPTNKLLLPILLTKIPNIDRLGIVRLIVAHFESYLEELKQIAESPTSDCDFKLSPNKSTLGSEIETARAARKLQQLEVDRADTAASPNMVPAGSNPDCPPSIHDIKAGFLLFRVKSLIDCHDSYKQQHTPAELKSYKNSCPPDLQKLYPQIITQKHLDDIKDNAMCLKYLQHLYEKKEAIKNMTQLTINEVVKYELAGVSKQSNADGSISEVIKPAENKTEAIIRYIRRITETMNAYIEQKWQHEKEQEGLIYESAWSNFESLNNIINCHNNRIPNLAAQIVILFLNFPMFNSEDILDKLIVRFNEEYGSECTMLPADVLLVPSQYTKLCYYPLLPTKKQLEDIMGSSLGFPDGVRITINALVSDQKQQINIRDIDLVALEKMEAEAIPEQEGRKRMLASDSSDADSMSDDSMSYDSMSDDSRRPRYVAKRPKLGGYNKGKKKFTLKKKIVKKTNEKLKTKSKKTRRQKNLRKVTLKHKKPRKHKSIKHKYRKHKL
jgi:hypothetical protein